VNVPGTDESALFEQVRRLLVRDDLRGGFVPVVIGYWDQRGYTYCTTCIPPAPLPGRTDEISGDNCAAIGVRCDFCGVSILKAALAKESN
jgi:hypothetical protein